MLARLCVSSHPAATWAEVVEPWLRAHGANWRERRTVLAPNAVWLAALKAGAVAAGLPVLGLEWSTPGRWRARALAALPGPKRHVALREDLHLLLELAAGNLPVNPLARAYGADPAPFQELLDALDGAGWDFSVLPDAHARELAAAAVKLRANMGWLTTAAVDALLSEAAASDTLPQLGEKLLVVGFGPSDWSLGALLETAASACAHVEFVLDAAENTVERETAGAAWVGMWEEKFGGTAEWLVAPVEQPAPHAPLAAAISSPATGGVKGNFPGRQPAPLLWLAENLQAEADIVTAQALAFLGEDENARVGVVVGSAASPLAREVAARFAALGCPHYDATGHLPGRDSAQTLFESWLDWQEDGRLAGLVHWVRAAGQHGLLGEKSAADIEKSLREAVQALLTDEPAALAAWLQSSPGNTLEACAFLADWPRLAESARGTDFLDKILAVSKKLRWPAEPETLTQRAEAWREKLSVLVPRAAMMRWVRAVSRVPGRTRAALGREPWSRLQIVDAAGAAAQTWTHLILGGLQHGEWPADRRDSPLLAEAEAEKLNRQTLRQGPHGEGHWSVAPGRRLLLTTADYRRLDRANFARLVSWPTQGLALTARETDPVDGRRARLSEYFWAVARITLGRLPTEEDWKNLAAITRQQRALAANHLGQNPPKLFLEEIRAAPPPAQTARAHAARRDEQTKFGEFSFCLRVPPPSPLRLSCKAWEDAAKRPGATWIKSILRARPRWDPAEDDDARLSVGLWAHEWARPGPKEMPESFSRPNFETWRKFSADAAEKFRAAAQSAFAAAGRELPESWRDAQADAVRLAGRWISALSELSGWPQALAEISLPRDLSVSLPGLAEKIPLTGRMDLVLFSQPVLFAPDKLGGAQAWLFDFKSGADKALSIKALAKGEGLQLALYALALRTLGVGAVDLTLLNAEADASAQLQDGDLAAPDLVERWRLLADFAVRGAWGEFCDLADEHARPGDYPSATLPVPVEILGRKWQRTHGVPA